MRLTVCIIWSKYILMKRRVTITLDPEIHRLAKRRAHLDHTSLSGLIESLIKTTSTSKNHGDLLSSMTGCARLRKPEPGTDPLHEILSAKYIR